MSRVETLLVPTAVFLWLSALILTTVTHELGHALVARALGARPTLYHTYVDTRGVAGTQAVLTAAGGPLMSLLQGGAFLILLRVRPFGEGEPALQLLLVFLAGLGFSTCFGYLLIAPFTTSGDVGKIRVLLGWPWWAGALLSVAGAAGITWIARLSGSELLALWPRGAAEVPARTALLRIGILPWLTTTAAMVVLLRPTPNALATAYPFFAGFYLLIAVLDRPDWPLAPAAMGRWTGTALSASACLAAATVFLFLRLKSGVRLG